MRVNLEDIVTYKGVTGKVDFVDDSYFTIIVNSAGHRSFHTRLIVPWNEKYEIQCSS
tara:strand:+ start:289 stop:459 length:171 start_codon:yes stop_codon:yes gene_type:complete